MNQYEKSIEAYFQPECSTVIYQSKESLLRPLKELKFVSGRGAIPIQLKSQSAHHIDQRRAVTQVSDKSMDKGKNFFLNECQSSTLSFMEKIPSIQSYTLDEDEQCMLKIIQLELKHVINKYKGQLDKCERNQKAVKQMNNEYQLYYRQPSQQQNQKNELTQRKNSSINSARRSEQILRNSQVSRSRQINSFYKQNYQKNKENQNTLKKSLQSNFSGVSSLKSKQK